MQSAIRHNQQVQRVRDRKEAGKHNCCGDIGRDFLLDTL